MTSIREWERACDASLRASEQRRTTVEPPAWRLGVFLLAVLGTVAVLGTIAAVVLA